MLIFKVSKLRTNRVQQPRQWAVMGSGTGNHLWRNNTLTRIFTPGILPYIVPSPSGSAQNLHRLFCWGFLRGDLQNPNHQPNRWVSLTTSTPVHDNAAVFLLEVTLRTKSPGQPTTRMAPFFQQVTTLKMLFTGRPLENIGQSALG